MKTLVIVAALALAGCGHSTMRFESRDSPSPVLLDTENQSLGGGKLPPGTPGLTVHGYATDIRAASQSTRQEGFQDVTETTSTFATLASGTAGPDWQLLMSTQGKANAPVTARVDCRGTVFFFVMVLLRGHTCLVETEVHAEATVYGSAATAGASFP